MSFKGFFADGLLWIYLLVVLVSWIDAWMTLRYVGKRINGCVFYEKNVVGKKIMDLGKVWMFVYPVIVSGIVIFASLYFDYEVKVFVGFAGFLVLLFRFGIVVKNWFLISSIKAGKRVCE